MRGYSSDQVRCSRGLATRIPQGPVSFLSLTSCPISAWLATHWARSGRKTGSQVLRQEEAPVGLGQLIPKALALWALFLWCPFQPF